MPRVPVLKTKTQISTNVPGRQATPAMTATSRAVSGLTKTVSSLAFRVAEGQQRQKDSTGEFELSNELSKTANIFENTNKRKIDIDGSVDGIDYTESKRDSLQRVQDDQLEKYANTVSSDALNRMKLKSKSFIDNAVIKADRVKQSISSRKAVIKGQELVQDSVNIATASGDNLQAYTAINNAAKYQITRSENFTPDEAARFNKNAASDISFGLTQGQLSNGNSLAAIKTAGLENDVDVLSSLSDDEIIALQNLPMKNLSNNMSASQKNRIKSQSISAIKTADRIAANNVKEGINTVKAGMNTPGITPEDLKNRLSQVLTDARKLPVNDASDVLMEVSRLNTITEVGSELDSLPVDKWDSRVSESLAEMADGTLEEKVSKKKMGSYFQNSINKRKEMIQNDFPAYAQRVSQEVQKSALSSIESPEGFSSHAKLLRAKASDFGRKPEDIKITSPEFRAQYKGGLESSNVGLINESLTKIQEVAGVDFAKALGETTKDRNILTMASIGDQDYAQQYLTAIKDKDFSTKWKAHLELNPDAKEDFKKVITEVTADSTFGDSDSFDYFNEMQDPASREASVNALQKTYQSLSMPPYNMSHSDAVEKLKTLFAGKDGKYSVARNSDGLGSTLIIPKINAASLDAEKAQVGVEKLMDNPSKFEHIIGKLPEFLTAARFKEEFKLRTTPDELGVMIVGIGGEPYFSNEEEVKFSWNDLADIADTEDEEFVTTPTSDPFVKASQDILSRLRE